MDVALNLLVSVGTKARRGTVWRRVRSIPHTVARLHHYRRRMAMKYRAAERGERTIYVEHGVWYDAKTAHIHVTVPGFEGAHWSYGRSDRKYTLYRGMLEEAGRWPEGVE